MQEPRSQASSGRQPAAAGAVQCAPFGPLLARFTGRRTACTASSGPGGRRGPVLPRYGRRALPRCRSGHRTLEVVVMKSLKDLERKLAYSVLARDDAAGPGRDAGYAVLGDVDRMPGRRAPTFHTVPEQAVPGRSDDGSADLGGGDGGAGWQGGDPWLADDRTSMLVNRGRGSAYHPAFFRRRPVLYVTAATVAALVISLIIVMLTGGASWPSSVGTMQGEITTACQNPDVVSEPGQINFACAKGTQQILWVFALLASSGSPQFADSKSGRIGLEPIAPAQGAEVAWSLNLHHPYDPANPIDSLQVAARAINNIIGGASAIGANGSPSVQPGLESDPSNCRPVHRLRRSQHPRGFPERVQPAHHDHRTAGGPRRRRL